MFWRMLVAEESAVDRFLIRDADSRVNEREAACVREWIASGKGFHVIRDHPNHAKPVMGGLWGARSEIMPGLVEQIHLWTALSLAHERDEIYDSDQAFLARIIWPRFKVDSIQHDSCLLAHFHGSVPIPGDTGTPTAEAWRFCGERFDENDQADPRGWQERINRMTWEANATGENR